MKVYTLVYIVRGNSVCLGLKKKKIGKGKWVAPGGKLEDGETLLECAVREVYEELALTVSAENLQYVARNEFFVDGDSEQDAMVHTYVARLFLGEPRESEELGTPTWFSIDNLPFERMWSSDSHWLLKALRGEKLHGRFYFTKGHDVLIRAEVSAL